MSSDSEETDRAFWESIADSWLHDFCAEGQDPWATEFNLPAFMDLVPSPGRLTLDVGCGEGRVARLLRAAGHHVIGTDGSPTLTRAAERSGLAAAVADGAHLPFGNAQADLVVSSMVLMDVDDLDAHLGELARILTPGGTLCLSILHPVRLSGFAMGDEYDTFALGDYLHSQRHDWTTKRNGQPARLRFWKRPISDYVNALDRAGLNVNQMREPRPDQAFVTAHDAASFTRVPMFLHLRASRRPN